MWPFCFVAFQVCWNVDFLKKYDEKLTKLLLYNIAGIQHFRKSRSQHHRYSTIRHCKDSAIQRSRNSVNEQLIKVTVQQSNDSINVKFSNQTNNPAIVLCVCTKAHCEINIYVIDNKFIINLCINYWICIDIRSRF